MKKSHLPHRCLYEGFGKEIVRIFKMKFLRNAGVGMSYHGIPAILLQKVRYGNPMKKATGWRKVVRLFFWGGLICLAAAAAVVGGCNAIVKLSARGRLYSDVQEIPYRQVGLVLGTSPTLGNGSRNQYYDNRIKATANLYFAGKISYILISGDNHRHGYNEPEEMRQSLIALGIPDSAIILDYAGFRTYDSMVRAYKVFGQRSLTVISQYWHNERAVFIARRNGMDAIGFNAQDVSYRRSYLKNHLREVFAKIKAVWDVATGKKPRYWGEPVSIPDGQTTEFKDSIRHLAPTAE